MKLKYLLKIIVILFITIPAFGQIDSIQNRKIYNWNLNQYDLSIDYIDVDTSLYLFHNYNPLLKNTITSNYLGNMGSPAQSNIYYDRKKFNTGFIFSQPYGMYFHLPENQKYYNTKRQFTLIDYSNTGPKDESEQIIGVVHTQNITKDFNVGVNYDMISSDGRYLNQEIKQNSITLFSSFKHKGYKLHTNYNLNRVKAQENGGIDSLGYLGSNEYKKRRNIPVKLDGASTHVFSTNFYLAQEYEFGKTKREMKISEVKKRNNDDESKLEKGKINKGVSKRYISGKNEIDEKLKETGYNLNDSLFQIDSLEIAYDTSYIDIHELSGFSISHELIYNKDVRKYFDKTIDESFYEPKDIFIDSAKTNDKVNQKQFANRFSLLYRNENNLSARLSFYNEQMTYQSKLDTVFKIDANGLRDTILKTDPEKTYSNNALSLLLKFKVLRNLKIEGFGEYYISGYKKENSNVKLDLTYNIFKQNDIGIKSNYSNSKPDYFYQNFSSNHFQWENQNLRMIEEWDASFFYQNKRHYVNASIKYGQITNYLYLDQTANTNQFKGQINILSGEISKRIKLGLINSVTRFVYQETTNDSILSIPKYNIYQSLFIEKLTNFKATGGKLLWQIGVDYRFASSYTADAYMPITGMFYRQLEIEQENYHRFDVFINFTIKRARFYLKYSYINSAINEKYYFTAPFYPSPEPAFQFGLAWTFYD